MSGSCLLAAIALGLLVAALSVIVPAAGNMREGDKSRHSLATTLHCRRILPRSLLYAAFILFLVVALQFRCREDLSPASLLEITQLGLFVLIAGIDIEHRRIVPLSLALVATLTLALAAQTDALRTALTGGVAGALAGSILYAGGRLYRRLMLRFRRELPGIDPFGAADALLVGVCGLYAGWPSIVLALLLGIMGAGAAAAALLLAGRVTQQSALPLAPFLLAGALLASRTSEAVMLPAGLFG